MDPDIRAQANTHYNSKCSPQDQIFIKRTELNQCAKGEYNIDDYRQSIVSYYRQRPTRCGS